MKNIKPKSNIAAERAVLSGLCRFGRDALIEVEDLLNLNTFTVELNQVLYKCFVGVLEKNENLDIPLILASSTELKLEEIVNNTTNLQYISALFSFPVKLENVREFAVKIKKIEISRLAQFRAKELYYQLAEVTGQESISEILDIINDPFEQLISDLNTGVSHEPVLLSKDSDEILQHLIDNPAKIPGISTGFPIFDEIIGGGIRPGTVHLIGARPKAGKSSLGLQVGLHVSGKLRIPILYLDTEMTHEKMLYRGLSNLSMIGRRNIETGQFAERFYHPVIKANEQLKEHVFQYERVTGIQFNEILSLCKRWIKKTVKKDENLNTNPALIIYDYFKLTDEGQMKNMQEYQVIGFQMTKLTDFCNLNNIGCLAFVQLNRQGAEQDSSITISQSDRLLWTCSSFSLFKRKTSEEIVNDGPENGNMRLIPLECRDGEGLEDGDYININFQKAIHRMVELNTKNQVRQKEKLKQQGFPDDHGFEQSD